MRGPGRRSSAHRPVETSAPLVQHQVILTHRPNRCTRCTPPRRGGGERPPAHRPVGLISMAKKQSAIMQRAGDFRMTPPEGIARAFVWKDRVLRRPHRPPGLDGPRRTAARSTGVACADAVGAPAESPKDGNRADQGIHTGAWSSTRCSSCPAQGDAAKHGRRGASPRCLP
jgi:hypothetical protein